MQCIGLGSGLGLWLGLGLGFGLGLRLGLGSGSELGAVPMLPTSAQVPLTLVGTAVAAVEVTVNAPGSAIGWAAWAVAAAVAASGILFDPAALLLLLLGAAHAAALLIGATSLMPARQLQPQHLPRSPDPSPDPHQVRRA